MIKYNSKFDGLVRIRTSQIKWLKKNKPKEIKTVAGFLDVIINNYKKYDSR
jgi:hypothetical protein